MFSFNWSFLFWFAIAIGMYYMYISPKIELIKSLKYDKSLHTHVTTIERGEPHDPRSVKKMKKHMQGFFMEQANTYENTGSVDKLKKEYENVMKYARRVPFRLPNDGHLYEDINNANDNLEKILKNYLFDAANRYNTYLKF